MSSCGRNNKKSLRSESCRHRLAENDLNPGISVKLEAYSNSGIALKVGLVLRAVGSCAGEPQTGRRRKAESSIGKLIIEIGRLNPPRV
jgi:hypothetical protein